MESSTKAWMATAIPSKGGSGAYSVDKCVEFIEANGEKDAAIIIRSDQEASMQILVQEIIVNRNQARTVVEVSPSQSSGSNGVVEPAVQKIAGKIRAIHLGLEERRHVFKFCGGCAKIL